MKTLAALTVAVALAGCSNDAVDDELTPMRSADIPHVVSAQKAVSTAHVSTLDPETMNDAEVTKALGEGAFCAFRYASDGKPVLAWKQPTQGAAGTAVVKLNGLLVPLERQEKQGAAQFTADDIVMSLGSPQAPAVKSPNLARPTQATLTFEIRQKLRVGYGGYTVCAV
jgi:hypothetical protein